MIRYQYEGQGVAGFAPLASTYSAAEQLAMFESMLRIRRIEEEIERRYNQDHMKTPIHLVIGQERRRSARAPRCAPPI